MSALEATLSVPRRPEREKIYDLIDNIGRLILKKGWGIELEDLPHPWQALLLIKDLMQELSDVVEDQAETLQYSGFLFPILEVPASEPPSQQSHNGGSSGGTGYRKRKSQTGEQHPHQDYDGGHNTDRPAGDSDEDGDEQPNKRQSKRGKHAEEQPDLKFPCPFRKRNPLRFNFRKYEECASRTFTISLLKLVYH